MRLSTKSRFAVTAMVNLALRGSKAPATLSCLSENQGVSVSYLEQLFSRLREKGLVRGVRGPGGGYYLAHEPDAISVGEIICAVDGQDEQTADDGFDSSNSCRPCKSKSLWNDLSQQLLDFLSDISLGDLVRCSNKRENVCETKDTKPALTDVTKQAA